jgi:Fic family protein
MKKFNYQQFNNLKVDVETLRLVAEIHEYRGKQALFIRQFPDVVNKLTMVAMIQSTDASNRIEGIRTTNDRLRAIMAEKATPHSRDEQEISGYRDVLGMIHDSYEHIDLNVTNILTLHNRLYAYYPNNFSGKWKNSDNVIEELDDAGAKRVRFKPAPAYLTPELMRELTSEFQRVQEAGQVDSLLLIPAFIFDFLSIHPFRDGNGRMSRLLSLLLLYQAGYFVGKYISLEMLIEQSKESYYEALSDSSIGWWDNKQDLTAFTKYFLKVLYRAYHEFEDRFAVAQCDKLSSAERIVKLLRECLVPVSRADVVMLLPDISEITIKRALAELVVEAKVVKIGGGRSTKYQLAE